MTAAYRLGGAPGITGLNFDQQDWYGVHVEDQLPEYAQGLKLCLQTPILDLKSSAQPSQHMLRIASD